MQTADDFIREYFEDRTREIQKEIDARASFRRRYFAEQCLWESRKGEVERSASEVIITVSIQGSNATVITAETDPFPKLRYHLKVSDGNWLIWAVETECFLCRGSGKAGKCRPCGGLGWLGGTDHSEGIRRLASARRDEPLPPRRW